MAGLQITFQLLAHFQSGHDRHHDVTYNHLRLERRSPFQSFLPVCSRIYLIYLFKNLRQYFSHFRVIFYNQYFSVLSGFTISEISVELSAEGDNDIVISVNNLGVGIDKSKIKHVFERFWQDDSATTTRTVKGSGI